ncbi:MAG: hypothetical protein AVDCRST_MAG87-3218, partial [uncultured Thermomicrobiales bacterium]
VRRKGHRLTNRAGDQQSGTDNGTGARKPQRPVGKPERDRIPAPSPRSSLCGSL